MNDNRKNIEHNNGWILCPSKSFPGKFYYFNVRSGETVWSLNQTDNKGVRKERSIHKIAEKSHEYPEPTTLPDESSVTSHNIQTDKKKPEFLCNPSTHQLPTFGQATYPKYVANLDQLFPNIIWTSVPFPMICPETMKPLIDKINQIPESEHKQNHLKKNENLESIPESEHKQKHFKKNENLESIPEPEHNQKHLKKYENLESTDLRFLLLAKRKSMNGTTNTAVDRKKPKATELKPLTLKQKITFNIPDISDEGNHSDRTQEDFNSLTTNHTATTIDTQTSPVLIKDNKTRPYFIKDNYPDASKEVPCAMTGVPTYKNKTWFIVVDTEVLLLEYKLIDEVVLSDPKCKLVIPQAVAADIKVLSAGDSHGQQKIINARQLTRRLFSPPPHYIVQPAARIDNGNIVVTTDSILQCCLKAVSKNYYVVLITNDPHLQNRATSLKIPSYKVHEIKYGVDFKPNLTSEPKSIKIDNTSKVDVIDTKKQYNMNINFTNNSKMKPVITSEKRNTEINILRKDNGEKNHSVNNSSLFNFRNSVKKRLFSSSDSDTENSSDCDKLTLISVTKPKFLQQSEYLTKYDSNGIFDVSNDILSLKIKDKNISKTENVVRNPFSSQNVKEKGFASYEKRIPKLDTIFEKTNPVSKKNFEEQNFWETNFENTGNLFTSAPIANMKQFQSSQVEKSEKPSTYLANKILNPSQTRIKRLINSISNDSTARTSPDNLITETKGRTAVFKIPKLIPIKNGTRNTSVHGKNSTPNAKIGTCTTIDTIEENLRRFRVKSRSMMQKLETRIDEWICSYMQIMEDALIHVLQENSVCMKNTVAPLSLKDTLNCIKMLHGSHTTVRDITNTLSELLDKCIVSVQGKFKISMVPGDFMKIFGCGVLLVQTLKNILPLNEDLKEAELRLNFLQSNIENKIKEMDPELVRTPSMSRTDKDEEVRPIFVKTASYVEDYLKKHFKNVDIDGHTKHLNEQNHNVENHSDFKVVRTLGKNLNLLTIGRSKTMSLANNTVENNSANKSKSEPKLITLIENNQIIKLNNIEHVNIAKNQTGTNLLELSNNENNNYDLDLDSEDNEILSEPEKDSPLKENKDQDKNNVSKMTEELNFTSHGNTFLTNTEKDAPKIVRNIKLIDEFEKKIQKKEPLDFDLLDYSEVHESFVEENLEFDDILEKNKNSEENTYEKNNDNNNYGLTDMSSLKDFYLSPSISIDSKNNNYTFNSNNTVTEDSNNRAKQNTSKDNTSYYFNPLSDNDKNPENKTDKDNAEVYSETYTENSDIHIVNTENYINDNSEDYKDNSGTRIEKSANPDYGIHLDNSKMQIDNLDKTAEIVQDDSTNDSGFENDSTIAHSMVKIFLKELSTTFKVIYTFVTKFVGEILEKELSEQRKEVLHNQASKSLEDMVAIIQLLRSIIKRESSEDTVLKTLLRNAGVEATTDKRMTRYRQIVIKCLEQASILESALKIIVSITIGDFDALSTNAESINSSIRYFNIFE